MFSQRIALKYVWLALSLGLLDCSSAHAASTTNDLVLSAPVGARFQFGGWVGERIEANIDHWLLTTPDANPGMLGMFHARDRQPPPNLVPWAGEFVGKYLISAVQATRMSDRPELQKTVADVVAQLVASQAQDGYLGPFPRQQRLTGHWDLWGHYHCLLGLLMWHEATGDQAALRCATRAADLVCGTYLDTNKRMINAGSDEMNLAIIHGLGRLYRLTKESRYLRMMHEIEKDWERAGDYFRSGLEGVEFFQSPRPRWESLHDLQGLVELFLITDDTRYRTAFEHQWRSIARWDVRNTGGFSSGEQATGNPYAPTPIETCCSIAWMALSLDMLNLTGDARVADMVELATYNAWAGAQHPSGRWCTYSTPMDGVREASAHSIVFQARAGTPELNCCSVNGPRGWGMLSEWAVMSAADGVAINYYGPFMARLAGPNHTKLGIQCAGNYPITSQVKIVITPERETEFALQLRIPAWAEGTTVAVNGQKLRSVAAGKYLRISRRWRAGDTVEMNLPLELRAVAGDREARGRASIYRGPLLLAWDQIHHAYDENEIPSLDLGSLRRATSSANLAKDVVAPRMAQPQVMVELPGVDGRKVRLCDFASAGSTGSRYRSWLPVRASLPAPVVTRSPRDGATMPSGKSVFSWRPLSRGNTNPVSYELVISDTENFATPLVRLGPVGDPRMIVDLGTNFHNNRWYYWQILARNELGVTASVQPPARFHVDPSLRFVNEAMAGLPSIGPGGEWVAAALHGNPKPRFGRLMEDAAKGWSAAAGRLDEAGGAIELDGKSQRVRYAIVDWPEETYSVSLWFRLSELPKGRIGQVISAWSAPSDDPLRVCVDGGKVFARIEAGKAYSTEGAPVVPERWYHVAAVKAGARLSLFLDGKKISATDAPEFVTTGAGDLALGGNPHFQGNEFLGVRLADLLFVPRAFGPEEVKQLSGR